MSRATSSAVIAAILTLAGQAWAGVRTEAEPNDDEAGAMAVTAGDRVRASFSHSRGQETRRGSDRDSYRLHGLSFPGTHVFRVKPGAKECRYHFGLTNFWGPFSGEASLAVSMDRQGRATYVYSGGGKAESKWSEWPKDPANNKLLLLEPVLFNSDKNGGFQCVKDGPILKELPYELLIDADGGAGDSAGTLTEPSKGGQAACLKEAEPDDRDNEATALPAGACVDGSWSYARSQETRRGTDRDVYRPSGAVWPGRYTFTVSPADPACAYSFGLTNFHGPYRGEASLSIDASEPGKATYLYSGGGQPESRVTFHTKDPIGDGLILIEPSFYNSSKDGGFQCVKDGPILKEIPYRLRFSGADGPSAGPGSLPKAIPAELTLAPGESWEGELPRSSSLEFSARLAYAKVAGASSVLEVWVDGKPVAGGLANKAARFQLADDRSFPYYETSVKAWNLFYSPDFSKNDSGEAGVYQVVTDPGQAYIYRFNLDPAGSGGTMKVLLKNNGLAKADIIIKGR